ncbi:hypothetical protein [Streptomyces sp. NPDC094031]|uniref:hypothetical protein n=1 Tax=Streptomyces sp. NPDC094031 TaxID=3155307 RepID=UPI00332FAB3A
MVYHSAVRKAPPSPSGLDETDQLTALAAVHEVGDSNAVPVVEPEARDEAEILTECTGLLKCLDDDGRARVLAYLTHRFGCGS